MVRIIFCFIFIFLSCNKSYEKYQYTSNIVEIDKIYGECNFINSSLYTLDSLSFKSSIRRLKASKDPCSNKLLDKFWIQNGFPRDLFLLGKLKSNSSISVFSFEEDVSEKIKNISGYIAVSNNSNNEYILLKILKKGIDEEVSLDFELLENTYILLIETTNVNYDIESSVKRRIKKKYCVLEIKEDNFMVLNEKQGREILDGL